MTSVLASSAIDCGFDPRSDQTKDYKTDICCFSANDVAVRSRRQNLVSSESGLCGRVERHVYMRTVVLGDSNPRSIAPEEHTLTITPSIWLTYDDHKAT
jgi:hypothetical protein